MKFVSTQNKNTAHSFQEVLISGLAKDGGLYMPEKFPFYDKKALNGDFVHIAKTVASYFLEDEISQEDLNTLCQEAYNFPIPIKQITENDLVLELFHGPTLAFKDFAARFMARCMGYFSIKEKKQHNILVATSGDTGGAIGHSFLGLRNVRVFILYPKNGVSSIQEKQLTTMGGNVFALEVEGNFDDCQNLVKQAFSDREFKAEFSLISANSINLGRVIPQTFYYLWMAHKLKGQHPHKKIVFSIPSGNLGNLTGAIFAHKMGAPIHKILVAQNANHPFVDYLKTANFLPHKSKKTISNAMDIGNPNNYERLKHFFNDDIKAFQSLLWGSSFTDTQTKEHIQTIWKRHNYVLCPHTAIGHLTSQQYRQKELSDSISVTIGTAHPFKFLDSIKPLIGRDIECPEAFAHYLNLPSKKYPIKNNISELKDRVSHT